MNRGLGVLLLTVSLVLILWPRIAHLDADPPVSLSQAFQNVGVFLYDEGWWAANARNRVLFGEWTFGSYNLMYVSPVFNLLTWGSFSIFGVSLRSARLSSLILGLLSLGLFFILSRQGLGLLWGTFAALVVGLSYPMVIYQRVALLEPTATFFALLAGFLWFRKRSAWAILSGAGVSLALLTKLSLAYFVLVFLILGILSWGSGGKSRLVWFAAGFVLAMGVWFFALFMPQKAQVLTAYAQYHSGRWMPAAAGNLSWGLNAAKVLGQSLVTGTIYRNEVLSKMPLLFLFSWLGALILLGHPRELSGTSAFFLLYAGIGGLFLTCSAYQPLRYFYPLLPALGYLTAAWARSAWTGRKPTGEKGGFRWWVSWVGWAGFAVVSAQLLYALMNPFLRRYLAGLSLPENNLFHAAPFSLSAALGEMFRRPSLALLPSLGWQRAWMALQAAGAIGSLAFGLALATLSFVFLRNVLRRLAHVLMRPGAVILILTLGLGFDLLQTWTWALFPKFTIRDFSRYLEKALPEGSVVSPGGAYALENRLRYDNSGLWTGKVVTYDPPVNAVILLTAHPLLGKGKLQDVLREHENAFLLKRVAVLEGQYQLAVFKLEKGNP